MSAEGCDMIQCPYEERAKRLERESDAAQARIERMVAGMIRLGALVGLPETAKVFEMECRLQDLVAAEIRVERLEAALQEAKRAATILRDIVHGHQDSQQFRDRPRGSHGMWAVRNEVAWEIRDLTDRIAGALEEKP